MDRTNDADVPPSAEKAEARFRAVFDAAQNAMAILDESGVITGWNRSAETLFACSSGEATGSNLARFVPDCAVGIETLGKPRELAGLRSDGEVLSIELTASAAGRAGDRFLVAVICDLSERAAGRVAEEAAARTARLQATTAALATVLTPAEAAEAAIDQGLGMFGAFSGSIFRLSPDGQRLELLVSRGIPADVLDQFRSLPLGAELPLAICAREGTPLFLDSNETIAARFPQGAGARRTPGARAAVLLPLRVSGEVIGVIHMNLASDRVFSADDRYFAQAVAQQCAHAIERAQLRERERRASDQASFLAEASEVLASSLQDDTVLQDLARLAVPRFADWCAIELVEAEITRQLAVAHADPAKVRWAWDMREKYPPERGAKNGVYNVVRTGKAELYESIPVELIRAGARDAEHFARIERLGMRSALIVPLAARGAAIGAITLVWAETPRNYSQEDLVFMTEFGRRAAMALENARLYRESRLAVQVRDDFLAVAGHELKTPLAALLLNVQSAQRAARKEPALAKMAERLGRAAQSGLRLGKLVDELLDVSRITAGRLRLEPERTDLSEAVHEVVASFADAANRAGSDLRVELEPEVIGIWDRGRLVQVIGNLIGNAIKYGAGKPIEITLGRVDSEAVLHVVDHGIGIEPHEQARIFGRFERAVATREFGGFGLGLWIASQVVDASSGSISVASTPGAGATFTVRLPIEPRKEKHA